MKTLEDDTDDDFYAFAAQGLARAYSEDEPDYNVSMTKELNPLYKPLDRQKTKSSKRMDVVKFFIAAVWFINGFFCKVLNLVPRHQQIVASILGNEHALFFTKTIGCLEILMAVWVISRICSRLCTVAQIILVASMNVIEFTLAPELLLFGRMNIIIATVFVVFLIWNEWSLNAPKSKTISIS